MKKLILGLFLLSATAMAQQAIMSLPRDATNIPLDQGLGNPYAFTLTPTTASYDAAVRYEIPKTGNDTGRVYRHLYVLNPSATRTAFVCFGDANGCTIDSFIVRPGYGLVFEPIRFGAAVGTPFVYVRLDDAGSQVVDLSIW
jgi:hypothetical protein